jgi:hypothetical protein
MASSCESKIAALFGAKSPGESMKIKVSYAELIDISTAIDIENCEAYHGRFDLSKLTNEKKRNMFTLAFVAHGGRISNDTSSVSGFTVSPT